MREKHKVELSVIVPAYRQARTIEASIRKLKEIGVDGIFSDFLELL